MKDHDELLYDAWCLIANAGCHQGGWESQCPDWVAAAIRWRDAWHATLPPLDAPDGPGVPRGGAHD